MKFLQRICLATTFILGTSFVAADEPSTAAESDQKESGSARKAGSRSGTRHFNQSGNGRRLNDIHYTDNGSGRQAPAKENSVGNKSPNLKDIEKRLASIEAQLQQVVLLVNRNTVNVKTVQARLDHQTIEGGKSDANTKQHLSELTSRLTHQTIQSSEVTQGLAKQIGELNSQLSQYIIADSERSGERANRQDSRLEYVESWMDHQIIEDSRFKSDAESRIADISSRLTHQVLAASDRDSRLKNLESRADHQVAAANSSAQEASQQLANLKAYLDNQVLAQTEIDGRIKSLESRADHQTVTSSNFERKAARQLADVKAQLNHQIITASERSHSGGTAAATTIQPVSGTGKTIDHAMHVHGATSHRHGHVVPGLPARLTSGGSPMSSQIKTVEQRQDSIEAKLDQILQMLQQESSK